jgi:hydrogenase maturation protease
MPEEPSLLRQPRRASGGGAVARPDRIGYDVGMKILVLGLGNPVLTDDSVGLRVAAELKQVLARRPEVEVGEDSCGGLRLMERMIGYDRAIVIDAIQTGAPPGTLHRLAVNSIPTQRTASAHDANLPTALALGRLAGAALPRDEDILVVGIEAHDVLSFGEECTSAVRDAIGPAVQLVVEAVDRLLD